MNSKNPKILTLLTLGEPENKRNWPDYLGRYDFTEQDTPALIDLFADEEISSMDSDSPEVWAQVHAWRILGQLGSEAAIEPIINSFDTLYDDDYAQSELPTVIGMIGPSAIPALCHYWQQPGKDAFSYGMAVDALCEIAKHTPMAREQVLTIYEDYMAKPDTSAGHFEWYFNRTIIRFKGGRIHRFDSTTIRTRLYRYKYGWRPRRS